MSEEFSEISNQSIRALIQCIVAIGNVLKKELPFDYLTPSWHIEDGTDNCTVWIFARLGEKHHSLVIYTHYVDAPPEPKGMYRPDCCVVATPKRWRVHHNDKWVPLSASYVAFLMGIKQSLLA